MQCSSLFSRRYFFLSLLLLSILYLLSPFNNHKLPSYAQIPWPLSSGSMGTGSSADVFDFPPVDSQAIRDMCSSVSWNSSLVFTCQNNHGGIAHVRNSILNCVRYAIAAGGSLVLPMIAQRGEDEIDGPTEIEKRHGIPRQGIEYMFDKNHFVDSLRKSCPELTLIRHMENTESERRRGLLPEKLFENVPAKGLEHPELWPKKLEAWIEKYMAKVPEKEPIILDLDQSFLHWPTHFDGHGIAHSFGNILKFRPDIRRLATSTLTSIATWYDLDFNLTSPLIVPSFFGAHLGTTNPLQSSERRSLKSKRHSDVEYSHYTAQSTAYLKSAFSSHNQIIYVASPSLQDINQLSHEAEEYNIAVTHKEDLLKGKERDEMEKLSWDQRSMIDFLVLTKGERFEGVGHEGFSWNVLLRRHEAAGEQGSVKLEKGVYETGVGRLYGVRESYVESSGCMWP